MSKLVSLDTLEKQCKNVLYGVTEKDRQLVDTVIHYILASAEAGDLGDDAVVIARCPGCGIVPPIQYGTEVCEYGTLRSARIACKTPSCGVKEKFEVNYYIPDDLAAPELRRRYRVEAENHLIKAWNDYATHLKKQGGIKDETDPSEL